MEKHSQLSCDGYNGPFSSILAFARQLQSPPAKTAVLPVRAKDVVSALDEQLTQIYIAGFRYAELWIVAAGLIAARSKSQVTTDIPASFVTMRIIKR